MRQEISLYRKNCLRDPVSGKMRGLAKQFFCMDTPGGENRVFGPENRGKVALAEEKISIDPAGAIWDGWDTSRRKSSIPTNGCIAIYPQISYNNREPK